MTMKLAADGKFKALLRGKELKGTWTFSDGSIAWTYEKAGLGHIANAVLEYSKASFVVRETDGTSTTYVRRDG